MTRSLPLLFLAACSAPAPPPPAPTLQLEPTPVAPPDPPRPASLRQYGQLLVAHTRDDDEDLGLLALVRESRIEPAEAERCKVMQVGARFDRLLGSQRVGDVTVKEVFSNEANVCLGHVTSGAGAHYIAVEGLETQALTAASFGRDLTHDMSSAAIAEVLRGSGGMGASNTELSMRGFGAGDASYAVATVAIGSPRFDACAPPPGAASGFAVFRVDEGGKFERLMVHAEAAGGNSPGGGWSLVDAVWLRGETEPWFVLAHDQCECWDFAVVAPVDGTWKLAVEGAGGCTI